MADLGKAHALEYTSLKDTRWIAESFRELAPKVRNLGGKVFGGRPELFTPQADFTRRGIVDESDYALNVFFPIARNHKARSEVIGYTLKLEIYDEQDHRRVSIASQASRQMDRPQASAALRKLLLLLSEADETLVQEGIPSAPEQEAPREVSVARDDAPVLQELRPDLKRAFMATPPLEFELLNDACGVFLLNYLNERIAGDEVVEQIINFDGSFGANPDAKYASCFVMTDERLIACRLDLSFVSSNALEIAPGAFEMLAWHYMEISSLQFRDVTRPGVPGCWVDLSDSSGNRFTAIAGDDPEYALSFLEAVREHVDSSAC